MKYNFFNLRNLFLVSIIFFTNCKKEKSYVYNVDTVKVEQEGSDKPNTKNSTEFISIAYSDIFGSTIPQNELDDINIAYLSFGDNKLIEDLIIRNFLTKPNKIPTISEMNADVAKFVSNTYKKLLNREPNEFEKWYLTDLIKKDTAITPELFYYSILTSDEYRKY